MIEVHPFGDFIPNNSKYLLLGSFTTKPKDNYVWFYANGRNHFWPIMEEVYQIPLNTKKRQQKMFEDLNMALSDIIYSCERKNNSHLDNNLTNIVYNLDGVRNIIQNNNIEKIFFSSRFVETTFRRIFKDIVEAHSGLELIYLPSPSPRYAAMSRADKIATFFLRDLAIIFELEEKISQQDYIYFQPIDTWVRQVAERLKIIDMKENNVNTIKGKIIEATLGEKVSPLLFNAGAWYIGKHSFDLLFDNE